MEKSKTLKGFHRKKLVDELHRKYAHSYSFSSKARFLRKKYLWLFCVEGSNMLKRILDIFISFILFVFLSPLIAILSLLIKLADGGPVLYITNRVGKWGKEFRFPKFRTMNLDANQAKESLKQYNMYSSDVKFKMLNDPRVTILGRILRKTSLDELPQLWCVLKGEMSLVGTSSPSSRRSQLLHP